MSMDTLIMTALSKDNHSYFGSDEEAEREDVTVEADRAFAREACFYCKVVRPTLRESPKALMETKGTTDVLLRCQTILMESLSSL